MKTYLSYLFTGLILLFFTGCQKPSTDLVAPDVEVITPWTNVDSLLGISDHVSFGVFADSLGAVFSVKNGFVFLEKGNSKPIRYTFPVRSEVIRLHLGTIKPVFSEGLAFAITSETTIDVIPYARPDVQPYTLNLSDFDLPMSPSGRVMFSLGTPLTISSTHTVLVPMDGGSAPYYRSVAQLNTDGKFKRNVLTGKVGNQVAYNDSTFIGIVYNDFSSGGQLFTTIGRKAVSNNVVTGTLLGELQQIMPDGTVKTSLPDVSVRNMFTFKNETYAVGSPSPEMYRVYKSPDYGINWSLFSDLPGLRGLKSSNVHFAVIDNRLVSYLIYLEEVNVEAAELRQLDLTGIPNFRGDITGIAEFGGQVYLTNSGKGVYRKPAKTLWQYTTTQ